MTDRTTRTLNPLPFEHLEPKRFEDLARQLCYGFRTWRQLEATGRTGADEGFDARGLEIPSGVAPELPADPEDETDELREVPPADRLWLIQCKREKSIGPAQMRAHLTAIPSSSTGGLHGFLFVAACDFSLKTRDVLRDWCREREIAECYVWGRGELEDLLFQPQNDGILFAYFGISLRLRRLRASTEIRRNVSLKRKLKRLIGEGGWHGTTVILRDPSDDRYPFIDGDSLKDTKSLWLPRKAIGLGVLGLKIIAREFWAYYDYDTKQWDFASGLDFAIPPEHENPWHDVQTAGEKVRSSREIADFWSSLPKNSQFFFQAVTDIPYQDIIEIDDVGDLMLQVPTIFMNFRNGSPPYSDRSRFRMYSGGSYSHEVEFSLENHALVFPDELRNPDWEDRFFKGMGVKRATERVAVTLTEPEWKRIARQGPSSGGGSSAVD